MRIRRHFLCLSLALLTVGCASRLPDYNGQTLYMANCANCHGTYGEGDGAVTPALNVVLQDLRYISQRNGGEFPKAWLEEIIDGRERRQGHGPIGMPVWGAVFSQQEGYDDAAQARVSAKVDALLSYLEAIQIQSAAVTN